MATSDCAPSAYLSEGSPDSERIIRLLVFEYNFPHPVSHISTGAWVYSLSGLLTARMLSVQVHVAESSGACIQELAPTVRRSHGLAWSTRLP